MPERIATGRGSLSAIATTGAWLTPSGNPSPSPFLAVERDWRGTPVAALSPGEHTLVAVAANEDGVLSAAVGAVTVQVSPPPLPEAREGDLAMTPPDEPPRSPDRFARQEGSLERLQVSVELLAVADLVGVQLEATVRGLAADELEWAFERGGCARGHHRERLLPSACSSTGSRAGARCVIAPWLEPGARPSPRPGSPCAARAPARPRRIERVPRGAPALGARPRATLESPPPSIATAPEPWPSHSPEAREPTDDRPQPPAPGTTPDESPPPAPSLALVPGPRGVFVGGGSVATTCRSALRCHARRY
jgi:hypothetical protein